MRLWSRVFRGKPQNITPTLEPTTLTTEKSNGIEMDNLNAPSIYQEARRLLNNLGVEQGRRLST